jgi:hypothetical protein
VNRGFDVTARSPFSRLRTATTTRAPRLIRAEADAKPTLQLGVVGLLAGVHHRGVATHFAEAIGAVVLAADHLPVFIPTSLDR